MNFFCSCHLRVPVFLPFNFRRNRGETELGRPFPLPSGRRGGRSASRLTLRDLRDPARFNLRATRSEPSTSSRNRTRTRLLGFRGPSARVSILAVDSAFALILPLKGVDFVRVCCRGRSACLVRGNSMVEWGSFTFLQPGIGLRCALLVY